MFFVFFCFFSTSFYVKHYTLVRFYNQTRSSLRFLNQSVSPLPAYAFNLPIIYPGLSLHLSQIHPAPHTRLLSSAGRGQYRLISWTALTWSVHCAWGKRDIWTHLLVWCFKKYIYFLKILSRIWKSSSPRCINRNNVLVFTLIENDQD